MVQIYTFFHSTPYFLTYILTFLCFFTFLPSFFACFMKISDNQNKTAGGLPAVLDIVM